MHVIDPLSDPRWTPFVERHSAACAFHTIGWLRALRLTYGYEPFAVTSSAPGRELEDAAPFCRIHSWATGPRLVSLPFTDHCQPLSTVRELVPFLTELAQREKYRFVELRPARAIAGTAIGRDHRSAAYVIHWLDLSPSLELIFHALDKDSIQRKIRRAERERLQYREGRSPDILNQFYALLLRTRRRHQLPPQPRSWFENLARSMGESIQFRIAVKDEMPVAAIVTLTHRNAMIYKYGCSDERFHAAGSMPFLFWRMIQDAKQASIPLLDFGRSDLDNPGLIRFKDQWGTRRAELAYYRFPAPAQPSGAPSLGERTAKALFARLPDPLLAMAGRMIYRHIG